MFAGNLGAVFPWMALGLLVGFGCGILYRKR